MQELISSEITGGILEQTDVIFGMIKDGIMELLDEHMCIFRTKMVAMLGARYLTFQDFHAYRAPELPGKKDPHC